MDKTQYLQDQVDSIDARIATANDSISSLQRKINALNNEIAAHQTDVANLQDIKAMLTNNQKTLP